MRYTYFTSVILQIPHVAPSRNETVFRGHLSFSRHLSTLTSSKINVGAFRQEQNDAQGLMIIKRVVYLQILCVTTA